MPAQAAGQTQTATAEAAASLQGQKQGGVHKRPLVVHAVSRAVRRHVFRYKGKTPISL